MIISKFNAFNNIKLYILLKIIVVRIRISFWTKLIKIMNFLLDGQWYAWENNTNEEKHSNVVVWKYTSGRKN